MEIDLKNSKSILVTGGAGFIGNNLIRFLLKNTRAKIFNLDKLGYSSSLEAIDNYLYDLKIDSRTRYELLNCNLICEQDLNNAIKYSKPDFIFNLAAESHVDRSIDSPFNFIESNITGTFNLLNTTLTYWKELKSCKKDCFRLIHISTDEVFGSLSNDDPKFNERTPYDPSSPYSASKASSDHLVNAWFHTYGLPVITTNCTNNYGPWQFPEKLIPLTILNALSNNSISVYGNGMNIRDWIYVDDHVNALCQIIQKASPGKKYCLGGNSERTNINVVKNICSILDEIKPSNRPYSELIKFVKDRPGHDNRYAVDSSKIKQEIGWSPNYNFEVALKKTVQWYIKNQNWCNKILKKSGYNKKRIGI